jgi:hypothetical protein
MNVLLAQMHQLVTEHQLTMDNVYLPRDLWLKAVAIAKKVTTPNDGSYDPKSGNMWLWGIRMYQHNGPFVMVLSSKNTRCFLFEVDRQSLEVMSYRLYISTYARKITTDAEVPGTTGV